MGYIKFPLFLIFLLMSAALIVFNADPVSFNYYYGRSELPLSLFLIGALCIGGLFGMLMSLGWVIGMKRENTKLRRQAKLAAEEVNNLRSIPIKDE